MKKLLSAVIALLALPALAVTEVTVGGNISVLQQREKVGSSDSKSHAQTNDWFIKAGYSFDIYHVGVAVDLRSHLAPGGVESFTDIGLVLGYRRRGYFADLLLIPVLNREFKSSVGDLKYEGGFSYGLDIGHRWQVAENLHFGVQLYYRNLNSTKRKPSSGASVDGEFHHHTIQPAVSVTYAF